MKSWSGFILLMLAALLATVVLMACCDEPQKKPAPLPPGTIVPLDNMGQAGWFVTEGTIRAIYIDHDEEFIVIQHDDGTVADLRFHLSHAPLFWPGEHLRLEYGGREFQNGPWTEYKAHRLPVPVKRETANVEPLSCQCVHTCQSQREVSRLSRHRRHTKRTRRHSVRNVRTSSDSQD